MPFPAFYSGLNGLTSASFASGGMGAGVTAAVVGTVACGLGLGVLLKASAAAPPTAATPETPALPTSHAMPAAVLVTLTAAAPTATTAQPLRLRAHTMVSIKVFIDLFPLLQRQTNWLINLKRCLKGGAVFQPARLIVPFHRLVVPDRWRSYRSCRR